MIPLITAVEKASLSVAALISAPTSSAARIGIAPVMRVSTTTTAVLCSEVIRMGAFSKAARAPAESTPAPSELRMALHLRSDELILLRAATNCAGVQQPGSTPSVQLGAIGPVLFRIECSWSSLLLREGAAAGRCASEPRDFGVAPLSRRTDFRRPASATQSRGFQREKL